MNVSRLKPIGIITTALLIIGVIGCRSQVPTRNPVKSIEPAEFDQIIGHESFSGLVAVIASWCPPCRKELPELVDLDRHYRDKGIQIVALSIDADGAKEVQPLINESKVEFPVYWVGTKGIAHYKIIGVPTLLIVRKGMVIEKRPGAQTGDSLEQHIKSLIRGAPQKQVTLLVDH